VPLLPTKTVTLLGFWWVGARGISRDLTVSRLLNLMVQILY
jgi:hypothetical protein